MYTASQEWIFVVRSVIIQTNADFQKIKDHFLADMPWFMINTDKIDGGQDAPSPVLWQVSGRYFRVLWWN